MDLRQVGLLPLSRCSCQTARFSELATFAAAGWLGLSDITVWSAEIFGMFAILPSPPRFHRRECRCALLPAVGNKVPLSSSSCRSPERSWNRTGYRPVLGFWVDRISIFATEWQAFCHLPMVSLLIWQQTSWNIHQNLIKQIYAIIYRFTFTKMLYKNWISWLIIRFIEISVMLYNQPMGSYFAVHSTLTNDFHSTRSEAKKGYFLLNLF